MDIIRYKTKEEARNRAREILNTLLSDTQEPTLLLCSGGSSLELVDGLALKNYITVSTLDERYSIDSSINNFSQLMNHVKAPKFIDTRIKAGESFEEFTERFERELREWKEKNPNGRVVITQGMGQDGHTAGIMPHTVCDDEEKWVIGYDAKEKNEYPLRVTTTFTFLRLVDYSIAYITGEKKKEALLRLLAEEGTLEETPARIMREMKNVKIFTDIV